MAAGSAALLAAAVKAAVQAKAPSRTAAAVAAAVTSVLTQPVTAAAQKDMVTSASPEVPGAPGTSEDLVQRLREARAAKRRAKRQRRRTEKAAQGSMSVETEEVAQDSPTTMVEVVESKRYPSTWEEAYAMSTAVKGSNTTVGSATARASQASRTVNCQHRKWQPAAGSFEDKFLQHGSQTEPFSRDTTRTGRREKTVPRQDRTLQPRKGPY